MNLTVEGINAELSIKTNANSKKEPNLKIRLKCRVQR